MSEVNISKYKKLSLIDQVLLRPTMWVGSDQPEIINNCYFIDENGKLSYKNVKIIPAFLKLFDEVISNSADHSKRPEGKHLNLISVSVSKMTGYITIIDNGGIPVIFNPEYDMYVPDYLFGDPMSGSNYDDTENRTGTGQNGLGVKLTNIFSEEFSVFTSDGKNSFSRIYKNNNKDRNKILIEKSTVRGTSISYLPDYKRFGLTGLDDDHYDMLLRRCWEIAATHTNIKVTFNGHHLKVDNFKKFCEIFSDDITYIENNGWKVGICHSNDGFKHISFVNGTATYIGGTHIDFVASKIVEEIRGYIEKKTKQNVKPSDIKNHFFLFIDATIYNPRYKGQIKEDLVTPVSNFGMKIDIDDKFIKRVLKSEVVREILEWAENRKKLEEAAEIRKAQKESQKTSYVVIPKYEPASHTNRVECCLMVGEGDSAKNSLLSVKNPKRGIFCLKGKPINVRDKKLLDLLQNEEFKNIMLILGLEIGKPANVEELNYGKLVIASDQDLDGYHISGLIINMMNHFWPELVSSGFIYRLDTPVMKIYSGKKLLHEFFSFEEYNIWESKQTKKNYTVKYCKGLGGHSTEDFKRYIENEKCYKRITVQDKEDIEYLDIAFSKDKDSANNRKLILGLQ